MKVDCSPATSCRRNRPVGLLPYSLRIIRSLLTLLRPLAETPCASHWHHGVVKSRTRLSDFTFPFHFPALEKEMATHSSVLAKSSPTYQSHLRETPRFPAALHLSPFSPPDRDRRFDSRALCGRCSRPSRPLSNSRGQRGSLPQTRRGLTLLSQLCIQARTLEWAAISFSSAGK